MKRVRSQTSGVIAATPQQVYAVLADYRHSHARILPKQFIDYTVEEGGQGAGTVFRATISVMGTTTTFRMRVTEPQADRVLSETDLDRDFGTTFTIDPADDSQHTKLTITSDWAAKPGIAGFFDRMATPLIMRRMYRQEIQNLRDYLQQHVATVA